MPQYQSLTLKVQKKRSLSPRL